MATDNKSIIRRIFDEAWNRGDTAILDEAVSQNWINVDPGNPNFAGRDGYKQLIKTYRAAFRDLRLNIDDMIVEGDKVVTRWTAQGTHTGELMGIPATNKRTSVTGLTIDRIVQGKIQESWSNWDTLGLMQSIGAVPQRATGGVSGAHPPAPHK